MSVHEMQATPLEGPPFERLRAGFRGALLRPGEEGYDDARRVWNGRSIAVRR